MTRRPLFAGLFLLAAACPSYDRYGRITDQDGLIEADRFARYGPEAALTIAIGRTYAAAWTGDDPGSGGRQIGQAVDYARDLPGVAGIVADSQAFLLTVQSRSGWRKAVLPIPDGVPPGRTPGVPDRP